MLNVFTAISIEEYRRIVENARVENILRKIKFINRVEGFLEKIRFLKFIYYPLLLLEFIVEELSYLFGRLARVFCKKEIERHFKKEEKNQVDFRLKNISLELNQLMHKHESTMKCFDNLQQENNQLKVTLRNLEHKLELIYENDLKRNNKDLFKLGQI